MTRFRLLNFGLLVCFVAVSDYALAPSAHADHYFPPNEVKDFISKNQSCALAFATGKAGKLNSKVYCMWDGVAGQGTIREERGCFLGTFDVYTNKYNSMFVPQVSMTGGVKGGCNAETMKRILMKTPVARFSGRGQGTVFQFWNDEVGSFQLWIVTDPLGVLANTKWNVVGKARVSTGSNKVIVMRGAPVKPQKKLPRMKIEDITVGSGDEVKVGKYVQLKYVEKLGSGQEVRHSTVNIQVGVDDYFQGRERQWLAGMKAGGKRRITLPATLSDATYEHPEAVPPSTIVIYEIEDVPVK